MHKAIPLKSPPSRRSMMLRALRQIVPAAAILICAGSLPAQAPSAQPASHKSAHARSHKSIAKPIQGAPVAVTPPTPEPPHWPVLNTAQHASVIWDSHGLRIDAANSSLQQILNDVATITGAKVEGMGQDQRVFGAYGPGQAQDVLSQLLQGSGYNVMLAGDLGQGAPRHIVLSSRRTGAAPAMANRPNQENSEEDPADNEIDEPPPPAPINQPAIQPIPPQGPVRTPQEIMQEMQQRQLQQQQQQQKQQANPPQQ
jgi:hypothetical protein